MSFPRYPKYKPSGVEWLGDVPEHWAAKKIGAISSLKGRLGWQGLKADEYRDSGPHVVSSAHFDNHQIQWDACPRVSLERYETDNNIQLAANDVLLMKDGAAMGKLAFVDSLPGPACLNSHLLLFRPVKVDGADAYCPRFAFYFMQTGYFQEHIKVNGTGATFLGISQDSISRYQLALPPLAEQTQISAFLDRETAKIDELVAEQRRLMELLKEKRQAVISHAVTQGLNPKAPMKPSGIEWLGDVPKHWEVGALRYFATFSTGSTPSREVERYWNGGIPWVKTGEINYAEITTTEETISEEGLASCAVSLASPGTLLMALYGQGVTRGRVALLGIHATFNQACVAISPDNRIDAGFLRAFFIFAYPFIRESGNETTQMNLSAEFVRRIRIPIPPADEQRKIAAYLEVASAQFDTLTAEAQRAIDLLQERRTALISAAVTGQIDVRTRQNN